MHAPIPPSLLHDPHPGTPSLPPGLLFVRSEHGALLLSGAHWLSARLFWQGVFKDELVTTLPVAGRVPHVAVLCEGQVLCFGVCHPNGQHLSVQELEHQVIMQTLA
jgi:hypothetical protein